ncbi:MAG TPA: excinuclease ABC subunit UvrA [Verrucomicrobiota bacterium]|nr:excinuclease ABC subunit UvrA [Verrucomicrobiota bacterium]
MAKDVIRVVGARQHNLKNLTLEIPRDRLVVITGPSGSGKSSLAFDTLFAEGQRKYVESLSVYARQFLDQLEKPDVDQIEGLSPAIAIEQRSSGANPRSTIATTTEIYDYLRLLFAHVGQPHDPETGRPMTRRTTTEIADELLSLRVGTRLMLLAPVVSQQKGEFRDVLERLAREGFVRARVDGQLVELIANKPVRLNAQTTHTIEVVVDRIVVAEEVRTRLVDSLETALKWGEGRATSLHQLPLAPASASQTGPTARGPGSAEASAWEEKQHSTRLFSPATGKTYDPPTAQHFSFNSPKGACPVCHGLGQKRVFDPTLVVPDETKSLEAGAVYPYRRLGGKRMVSYYKGLLKGMSQHYSVPMDRPWKQLPEGFRKALLHGTGSEEIEFWFMHAGAPRKTKKPFEGVLPNLERLYAESESEFTRNRLKAYMTLAPCDGCRGKRLKPELLAVTLGREGDPYSVISNPVETHTPLTTDPRITDYSPKIPGLNIAEFCALSIQAADEFLEKLTLNSLQRQIAGELIGDIRRRLQFLRQVGLGYLTLDRESATLSGGEAQRIRLATQIGAGLVGVLYILDEPSIGLHQRDNDRLLETLRRLRDLGNSVLVVEHDEDTMRAADHILDLGPGAGLRGGELVAQGTPAKIMANPLSVTGRYLTGDLRIEVPRKRVQPDADKGWLEILGCRENNLQNLDVRIPLGTLTCVTGVSGSGKSTVVDDILRRALFRQWYGSKERPGDHREIRGAELLEKCVIIDQAPIGRTPRSNPATYTGMFNEMRELFSKLPASRVRGYGSGRFSFNVRGGRCEKCEGDGALEIEMHFLPPVYVTCDVCGGRRYNRETLEITYKGLNISDVLNLSVDEAVTFFRAVPKLHDPCLTLAEVGLGYLKLGQPATTLSGGEAQRLKLASELSRKQTGQTLYLLDEPTTGLHFQDIAKLLEVLFKLRAAGNTLVVIEHNLDVIKTADWVIDLGPEGGAGGGRIVAQGTPESVAAVAASHTGRFLRRVLAKSTS